VGDFGEDLGKYDLNELDVEETAAVFLGPPPISVVDQAKQRESLPEWCVHHHSRARVVVGVWLLVRGCWCVAVGVLCFVPLHCSLPLAPMLNNAFRLFLVRALLLGAMTVEIGWQRLIHVY
jgi:hypothetical protein